MCVCVLRPSEGFVPLSGSSVPSSPGEGEDGKIHFPGARDNAPSARVYTKAPLKVSVPMGLSKGS